MVKIKDSKFYTELIITTVLSLVSASLWITWTKGMIRTHFKSSPTAVFGIALCTTLLAIFCLQYVAKSHRSNDMENIDKKIDPFSNGHPLEH